MIRRPPRSTLFPYTPLSRSPADEPLEQVAVRREDVDEAVARPGVVVGLAGTLLREGDVELAADVVDPEGREARSEEHTSELQSQSNLVCRLLLETKISTTAS